MPLSHYDKERKMEVIHSLKQFFLAAKNNTLPMSGVGLDLTAHKLSTQVASRLASILIRYRTPETLYINLWANDIDDHGIHASVEALKKIPAKRLELVLWQNQISCTGAKYLSELLPHLLSGSLIDVSGNVIGAKGAKYLLDVINSGRVRPGIKIKLHDNKLNEQSVTAFKQAQRRNDLVQMGMASLLCPKANIIEKKPPQLPQELWENIFSLASPFLDNDIKKRNQFTKNVFRFFSQHKKRKPNDKTISKPKRSRSCRIM